MYNDDNENEEELTFEDKQTIRSNIERHIEEFIANGGGIQQIEYGRRTHGIDDIEFNSFKSKVRGNYQDYHG